MINPMNKEEILEAITGEEFVDNGLMFEKKNVISPEKLATYLAELENRIDKIYHNCESQP